MKRILLSLLVAAYMLGPVSNLSANSHDGPEQKALSIVLYDPEALTVRFKSLAKITALLQSQSPALRAAVINTVVKALYCAATQGAVRGPILAVIDFSLPSSQKRLWVFDLNRSELLFHTYVTHGIRSGQAESLYFSNTPNSKASSIGVFNTENAYRGRHGLSLKLKGLDRGINHNAYRRFIVMHGSWYATEKFIKKYGRAGRSWGCPSLPLALTKPIIDKIKDHALLIAYYPSAKWVNESKFTTCVAWPHGKEKFMLAELPESPQVDNREEILFVDLNQNNAREINEPILGMSIEAYKKIYHKKPPLKRMLRRQINKTEFIALTKQELKALDKNKTGTLCVRQDKGFKDVNFIIPEVKRKRGYYATEMKIIEPGAVDYIKLDEKMTIYFKEKKSCSILSTRRFIRWLGL